MNVYLSVMVIDRMKSKGTGKPGKELFWIHLTGNGIKGIRPRADIMAKYLLAFDRLSQHVALYGGHVSRDFPRNAFHVYFKNTRKGCAAVGLGHMLDYEPLGDTPLDNVEKDIQEVLGHANDANGFKYISDMFKYPHQRITIYGDMKQFCPTTRLKIRITKTRPEEPFEKSGFDISFSENTREMIDSWMDMEITKDVPEIIGYFTGYRIRKNQFWIVLDDEQECRCLYDDDRVERVVSNLKRYDKVKVRGRVILTPERTPEIRDVVEVINLDLLDEQECDKLDFDDEYDADFVHELEKGEEDVKEGRLMSEAEFRRKLEEK